jgi:hypothetical protein
MATRTRERRLVTTDPVVTTGLPLKSQPSPTYRWTTAPTTGNVQVAEELFLSYAGASVT